MAYEKIENLQKDSTVNLIVTVKSKSQLKSWSKNKASGNVLKGVLEDETGTIDFVSWNDNATKLDTLLNVSKTYEIQNAKIVLAKQHYSTTKHPCQVVVEKNTLFEITNLPAKISPLILTSIVDLMNKDDHSAHNVVGKVVNISPPTKLGTTNADVVQCRLQDNTASIELSFIGDDINKLNFGIGDIVLLENITMRIFGQYHCLQANTGIRTINPKDRDFSKNMPVEGKHCVDLSPEKNLPQKKTVNTLSDQGNRQDITEKIVSTNIKESVYERCPKVQCRTRVFKLDNGFYRCNKCEFDYLIATFGVRLSLKIGKEKKDQKSVILFNEVAERFLNLTSHDLSIMDECKLQSLEDELVGLVCNMILIPGKNPGEFLCEKIKIQPESCMTQEKDSHMNKCVIVEMQEELKNPDFKQKCLSTDDKLLDDEQADKSLSFHTADDEPLNLCKKDISSNVSCASVNFNLEVPSTTPQTSDIPMDLSLASTAEKKKYTFKRKLDF